MRLAVRHVVLPLALIQIAVPALPFLVDWASPIGADAAGGAMRPPESPPGPFFAIWGVIFLAFLLFGLIAWREDTALSRRLAAPLASAAGLGALWMLLEQAAPSSVLGFPVLLGLAAAAFWGAYRFEAMRGLGGSPQKFTADLLTGLLAGWMSAATAIGTIDLVRGQLGLGNTDSVWPMLALALLIVGMLAILAIRSITRSVWYIAALVWALAGVFINNWALTGQHVQAVAVLAVGLVILRYRFRANPISLSRS